MPTPKIRAKISKAVNHAKQAKRFSILHLPEDRDEAPHWLFWWVVILFILLVISIIWQGMAASSSLQAYLPYI